MYTSQLCVSLLKYATHSKLLPRGAKASANGVPPAAGGATVNRAATVKFPTVTLKKCVPMSNPGTRAWTLRLPAASVETPEGRATLCPLISMLATGVDAEKLLPVIVTKSPGPPIDGVKMIDGDPDVPGLAVGAGAGVAVACGLDGGAVARGMAVGAGVAVACGVAVGAGVAVACGVAVGAGVAVACGAGASVGAGVAVADGADVAVGAGADVACGAFVAVGVAMAVGASGAAGVRVGVSVGAGTGVASGSEAGASSGMEVGTEVGSGTDVAVARAAAGVSVDGAVVAASQAARITMAPRLNSAILARAVIRGA